MVFFNRWVLGTASVVIRKKKKKTGMTNLTGPPYDASKIS